MTNSQKVLKKTHEAGVTEGRRQMRNEALTFLEEEFMQPTVARGSEEANAILELARRLSEHLKVLP